MKYRICLVLLIFSIFNSAFFTMNAVASEDYYRIDVFVLMDSSNSMKLSDPDKLRYQAFKDLAGQLETGDRIGLIQFGATSKLTIPLTEISDEKSREQLTKGNIPDENLVYTDVKDALQKAYQELQKVYDSGHLPFFIIFTDGDIEPTNDYEKNSSFKKKYLSELNELAQKYKSKNWPIYAINLNKKGRKGDPDLNEVNNTTGGYMVNIKSPQDIQNTFSEILKNIRIKKVEEEKKIQVEEEKIEAVKLKITSPEPGIYTLFNNMELHAEVTINEKRVIPGKNNDLKVDEFYAEISDSGREKKRIDLMDDGAVSNGDMKREDGIFSGFYKPVKEGAFTVSVHTKGKYKGKFFEDKNDIIDLEAAAAGKVTLNTLNPADVVELIEGKTNTVKIEAVVDSFRTERIELSIGGVESITLEPSACYLLNGAKNDIELKLHVPKNVSAGTKGEIVIRVTPAFIDTIASPGEIRLAYIIKPDKTLMYIIMGLEAAGLVLAISIVIYIVARIILKRRRWVKGTLYLWKNNNSIGRQYIKLNELKKEEIMVCPALKNDAGNELGLNEEINFKIYSEKNGLKIVYFVTGGIGNILYTGEIPHKTIKLEHELIFTVKSYTFYYYNPKMIANRDTGTNILQKYENQLTD